MSTDLRANWADATAFRPLTFIESPLARTEGEGSHTSHVTDVKLKIADLDSLDETCHRLGLTLHRDKKNWKWYGQFMNDSNRYGNLKPSEMGKGDHAISVNGAAGAYEIGLRSDGQGAYDLYYDSWGSGANIERVAGKDLNVLRKEYAFTTAQRKAKKTLGVKGWTTQRVDMPNGGIKLKLRKR